MAGRINPEVLDDPKELHCCIHGIDYDLPCKECTAEIELPPLKDLKIIRKDKIE